MKTLNPVLLLCAALCFAASCKKQVDMTLKQKTQFESADIRQIEVTHAWPVTVVYDAEQTFVEVEYSAYLEPYLKVRMDGTKLEIGFTGKVYAESGSVFRAVVHTSRVEKLKVTEASSVECQEFDGFFECQNLEIEMSEASQCHGLVASGETCEIKMEEAALMTGFQFVGNACSALLKGTSQFNGQIQVDDRFEVDLKEASRFVNRGGETNKVVLKLQNVSILNMAETEAKAMDVTFSGGSEATVFVTQTLDGTLTEGSTLYYKGNPQKNIECSDDSQLIPF